VPSLSSPLAADRIADPLRDDEGPVTIPCESPSSKR